MTTATLTHDIPNEPAKRERIRSVDIVRGAIMVLMALDHVRDFTIHNRTRPEDLINGSAALFATRWVTHFCAPTFALLAGVGIGILKNRGKPPAELSRYLLARGFWLLILELIITPVGWQLGFKLIPAFAVVLWSLGWSMILMAALVHVPKKPLAVASLIMIAGHNLLDGIKPEAFGKFSGLWNVLHVPGFMIPNVLFVAYPLIPWVAVMALGYVMADLYQLDDVRRKRILIRSGVAAIALFIVLRGLNLYGNPFPWSSQRTTALTISSFLNVNKYPPSLHFLLMTLGPALIALALTERARGRIADICSVYGRVPLFFYVCHIFVAHLLAITIAFIQGHQFVRIQVISNPQGIPAWYGVSLAGVYLAWIFVVAVMYYPCRRFARMKNTRRDWWLSYM